MDQYLDKMEKDRALKRERSRSFFDTTGSALTPIEGWISVGLLFGANMVAVAALQSSGWVDPMPRLWLIGPAAFFLGLAAAKVRGSVASQFIVSAVVVAAIGVLALWEAAGTISSPGLGTKFDELFSRLNEWVSVLGASGISNDKLPFAFGLGAITGLMTYLSSWFLFKHRWGWAAIIVPAWVLLTNQTYLPDSRYPLPLFFFLMLSILVLARTYYLSRMEHWRQERLAQVGGKYTFVANVAMLTAAVFIVGWAIPTRDVVIPQLKDGYQTARGPWRGLEDDFERLFAGIPSQRGSPLHSFGSALPLRGRVSLGSTPVFTVVTDFPAYWRGQSYDFYEGRGWIVEDDQRERLKGRDVYGTAVGEGYLKRDLVAQRVILHSSTEVLFAAGQPIDVSISSRVDVATPREYVIDLRGREPTTELPLDLAQAAERIVESRGDAAETAELLPSETYVVEERNGSLIVTRDAPSIPDVLSVRASSRLKENSTYDVISSLSIASPDELSRASADYPKWVTDNYLQLPKSLPERVRDLAAELTENADTPYAKALAVRDYLREYEETFDIEAPPLNSDAIDFFLFEQRAGYSDYFASSMAVLLRASGVPARLASGYSSGTWDPDASAFLVSLSDAHSWPEVFFPEYGWVPFEPSPSLIEFTRGPLEQAAGSLAELDTSEVPFDPFFDDFFLFDLGALDDILTPLQETEVTNIFRDIGIKVGWALAGLAGVMAVLFLIVYVFWEVRFLGLPYAQGIYARMSALGAFAWRTQKQPDTPVEYATALAMATESTVAHSQTIAGGFARARYGGRELTEAERHGMQVAWQTLRRELIQGIVRRLSPRRLWRS